MYIVLVHSQYTEILFIVCYPWLDSITDSMDINLGELQEIVRSREAWLAAVYAKSQTWLSDWKTTTHVSGVNPYPLLPDFWCLIIHCFLYFDSSFLIYFFSFKILFIFENLFYYFKFIYFNWRLIALQYCSGFCHTLTWISHGFTCVPHPEHPSHLLPIPSLRVFLVHQP